MTTKRNRRILLTLILAGIVAAGSWGVSRIVKLRPAEGETLSAEAPAEGIGRAPAVTRYLGAPEAMEIDTAEREILETYTEGEGPAPAWYRPDEPMSAEWEDQFRDAMKMIDDTKMIDDVTGINVGDKNVLCKDIGCPDWNLCSTLYGWDGHTAEPWEMELYTRITYLEFWGTSPECCEAGADSILRLWDTGYYGETLGELLSARAEDGSLVYSPFAYVWEWDYDPEGLADMRTLCEDRFYNGPEWEAPFFRLWYYHPWAEPMYQIDGVYFSTGKGWQ